MKRVILCGLGAVGTTFAVKLNSSCEIDFRVVVDELRLNKYTKNKPMFNGVKQEFKYILKNDNQENADLIIIATKSDGLEDAIESVKDFSGEETRIISLINGISSEEIIKEQLPKSKVLKSYFIGHSAVRFGNNIIQDGVGRIVTEEDNVLKEIFDKANIEYEFVEDIDYALWKKFAFNVFSNQVSALLKMNFGELKKNQAFKNFAKQITREICLIGEKKGIKNIENIEKDALKCLDEMCDEGKTSMLQDVISKRKTEVDIFSGEVIKLGKIYGIPTPYNQVLYDLIKIEEGRY